MTPLFQININVDDWSMNNQDGSSRDNNSSNTNDNGETGPEAPSGWQTVPSKKELKARAKKKTSREDQKNILMSDLPLAFTSPDADKRSVPVPPPFLLLLVGLPGSGKTRFATALQQSMPRYYVHVNQDMLGTRQACEDLARQALVEQQHHKKRSPVIDRCNVSVYQRQVFRSIAAECNVPVDCIVFDFSVEECTRRCELRRGHATLHPREAKQVIARMQLEYEDPNAAREGFRRLQRIVDEQSFQRVLQLYLHPG